MSAGLVAEHDVFETLRLSLSLVRKARVTMDLTSFDNAQTSAEANFHLGCAEIAILRLILEEERDLNEGAPDDTLLC